MSSSDFNSTVQVTATRASMGKRLGEIIEDIIGDARVRALFDAAGKHPEEYAGKPTGLMALDLKVITPDTKTALLIAQAAERTYALAEKASGIAAKHTELIEKGEKIGTADVVDYNHEIFKYVGSDRDPVLLQRAQGTWMAAQMLLNNEISSVNGHIENSGYVANEISEGTAAAEGFKKAAAELYAEAGKLMAQEGHSDAAAKFAAVSKALAATAGNGPTPSETMQSLGWSFSRGSQDLMIVLNDERYLEKQPIEAVFEKLQKLTAKKDDGPAGQGTAPAPAA